MRLSTSLLTALAASGGLAAQAETNELCNYQTNTSYTSRSTLAGQSEGWVTNRITPEFMRGVGQVWDGSAVVGRLNGWRYVLQDQVGNTPESYSVGFMFDTAAGSGTPAGTPDVNNPNNVTAGPFNFPSSTATGAVAWIFTLTLNTPADIVPENEDFYLGIHLSANSAWSNDGPSIHGCWFSAGNEGDAPSTNALNNGTIYEVVHVVDLTQDPTGQTITGNLDDRWHRIWMLSEGVDLKVGADVAGPFQRGSANPNYGFGGLYPDHVVRQDGLAFYVEDENYANDTVNYGVVGSFFSTGPMTANPLPLPLNGGQLWLELPGMFPFDWLFGLGSGLTGGVAEFTVIPTGTVPQVALGEFAFQGVVFGIDGSGTPFVKGSHARKFDSQ